ncbi:UPF0481 protein [Cocos nucifera]|uniref:UPF0481 protein n=1 Tax=Cocos nucifera TaxID=13894 RepID=A0A8K0MY63_COCNU|nr:UPF0481 protein [Cocos nucifera]
MSYHWVAPEPRCEVRSDEKSTTSEEIERIKQWAEEHSSTSGGKIEIKNAEWKIVHEVVSDIVPGTIKDKRTSTIFAVPPEILSVDGKAYEPKAVCIGPFFHHLRCGKHLQSMEIYKWVCVHKLMSKHKDSIEVLLRDCLRKMKELLARVRSKYSQNFNDIKPADFARMLMLDGCFLLNLLLRYADGPEKAELDDDDATPIVSRLWIWDVVRHDLLLLQNQIPFFVIQSLYELLNPHDKKNTNLVDCAINYFSPLDPCRKPKQTRFYIPVEDVHHLLHLIYLSLLPCPQYCKSRPGCCESDRWIPSATELGQAGIKFKRRNKACAPGFLSFLDVKFSDGVMEIPRLMVHDYSVSLLRNFIAFEQCYAGTQCHVTAYAAFMDFLIKTEKDVRLLYQNDILINSMTVDRDATLFFSRLRYQVHHPQDTNYLRRLLLDVNDYRQSKWRKWRLELFRDYFYSPWSIISAGAAALGLLVAIAQLVVAIVFR